MTRMGTGDGDGDELDALQRLISADSARLDEQDVILAVERFFGRPDTLELLREVAREERLIRRLRVGIGSGPGQGSGQRRCDEPGVLPITSLINDCHSSRATKPWWRVGLAAAAVLAMGAGLNWSAASRLLRTIRAGGGAQSRAAVTRAAEVDTVDLPDGSRAILAPNSSLHYAIAPLTGPRELELEGEAYFEVKHDHERPFRVRTRHAVVEDLGTSFVVREYAEDGRARVAVRSGAAALRARDGSGSSREILRRGEGAYIDSAGTVARFRGDPESYGAWTSGSLVFDAAQLPEVLASLSRWYGVQFRLSDSTLATQYFTGGVSSASLDKALAIMGPVVHARFEREGKVVVVSQRPERR